ncbi:subfamily IIIC HAD-superfamily phosphatase [Schinkia azotoformans MEV2011]|uniref:Subfamily IIIC HAD-superfamily phosphatase n=1 Tax=Schinkia azotoformans MEV2011 TaxID=1348973 RepID=A0A072P4B3_SCHAZ|nr:HAD-IIIC family phosphatase [Schinkia azotoformans]KEF40315.1 subfamily IIIC HAD-superfamily phosphatase [Schinkia azotoformans MEV2011]MEC1696376.1 HAD-IIIC family phosphatase [Schinkia azotoformans]MEC1724048.1 HAD-IIIC family phosphatase [Schinkia azotoformans]
MMELSQFSCLLNQELNSRDLKKFSFEMDTLKSIKLSIERTLPFEYIAKFMPPFLSLWDKEGIFSYSDYDPSLLQIFKEDDIDVYIFWMDWRLYMENMAPKQCAMWFSDRLLNTKSNCSILVNNWPSFWKLDEKQYSANLSKRGWIYQFNVQLELLKQDFIQLEIIDLDLLSSQIGMSSYDSRNDKVSNYPLSNQLTMQVARYISLNLLPAMLEPKLKAIVVDLDNTLYSGILGEDGIDGIQLTEEHIQFQKVLKNLKENGILLAISSKNDETDVLELFEKRRDFPLQKDDFTFLEANWNSKAENIKVMARKFNFDVSAMLFIDDNPAELMHVMSEIPTIHLLLADATGKEMVHRLVNFPRLYSLEKDELAEQRQQDILANQKRYELQAKMSDGNDYLNSLHMQIGIYENKKGHMQRVFELGQKSNQFNLALKRLTNSQVEERFKSKDYKIYTINLSDILNDSGIIGAFICQINEVTARFEEVFFSCRALGRKVEDAALYFILRKLHNEHIQFVQFDTVKGPRNKPALDWIQSVSLNNFENLVDIKNRLEEKLLDYPAEVIEKYE